MQSQTDICKGPLKVEFLVKFDRYKLQGCSHQRHSSLSATVLQTEEQHERPGKRTGRKNEERQEVNVPMIIIRRFT